MMVASRIASVIGSIGSIVSSIVSKIESSIFMQLPTYHSRLRHRGPRSSYHPGQANVINLAIDDLPPESFKQPHAQRLELRS